MNYPKISIVTPSYNQAPYLEQTLQSVLSQGYPNLEYIVMDGGSTDGSAEILRNYSERLTYWESAPDKGQADAIYRGFERATGDIIGWVNSDDLLLPGALHRVGAWFARNAREIWVVGGSILIDAHNAPIVRSRRGLPEADLGVTVTFERLLLHNCGGFHQPASFWRREAFFDCGGFDRNLRFCFDYDMFFRLAGRKKSGRIRSLLSAFRCHTDSKTSTLEDVCQAENEILWQRYGRYSRYSAKYLEDFGKRQQRQDRWRNRLTKALFYTGLLKVPRIETTHTL